MSCYVIDKEEGKTRRDMIKGNGESQGLSVSNKQQGKDSVSKYKSVSQFKQVIMLVIRAGWDSMLCGFMD